jgi:glutamyl-tRNA reductase
MSTLAAQALVRHGAGDLVVVNRTEERARNLAESWEARSFPLDRLVDAIAEADIVLSSTASTGVILDRSLIEKALSRREPERKLMIIDIAVPRDVDPDVSRIPGVELRNIDDLRMVVQATASARLSATEAVEAIIQDELERFDARRKAIEAAPLLAGLARKGEEIRLAEIERASSSLAGLSESQADAVERITKRIVAKLLHQPMESVRRIASSEAADLQIAALRDLFDLDG